MWLPAEKLYWFWCNSSIRFIQKVRLWNWLELNHLDYIWQLWISFHIYFQAELCQNISMRPFKTKTLIRHWSTTCCFDGTERWVTGVEFKRRLTKQALPTPQLFSQRQVSALKRSKMSESDITCWPDCGLESWEWLPVSCSAFFSSHGDVTMVSPSGSPLVRVKPTREWDRNKAIMFGRTKGGEENVISPNVNFKRTYCSSGHFGNYVFFQVWFGWLSTVCLTAVRAVHHEIIPLCGCGTMAWKWKQGSLLHSGWVLSWSL